MAANSVALVRRQTSVADDICVFNICDRTTSVNIYGTSPEPGFVPYGADRRICDRTFRVAGEAAQVCVLGAIEFAQGPT